MSLGTNTYGSNITAIRKARALYAFRAANTAAIASGASVLPEQGPAPLNSELLSRVLGGTQQVLPYPDARSQVQVREVNGCAPCGSGLPPPEITG